MKKYSKNLKKLWSGQDVLPQGYVGIYPSVVPTQAKTIFNAGKLLKLLNIPETECNELEVCCALYNLGQQRAVKLIERCITTYEVR